MSFIKLNHQSLTMHSFRKEYESGTTRLARPASKAFSSDGGEKNGAHGQLMALVIDYSKEKGLHALPLERFRGSM